MNRRSFVLSTAIAGAAAVLPGCAVLHRPAARSRARVIGPNDTIRVAIVGFNARGKDHIEGFLRQPGVQITALCDVDRRVLEAEAKKLADKGHPVATYTDVRKLLESPDIDCISTATPNHWHALISVWACQAGKDVYVEKPVSHNAWEGRQIVLAARKYGRIVQTGTQSRSNPGLRDAVSWIQAGNLGKIKVARGLCYKPRQSIGKVSGPTPIPDHIDYDLWCGPAPMTPLMRQKLHYDWHWQFATGNGDLGNQGIHQMDIARWILGEKTLSPGVFSVGGRFAYEDDGDTPNTQVVFHAYKRAPLIFEVRGLPKSKEFHKDGWGKNMPDYRGAQVGVVVDCEGGHVVIPSYDSAIAYDTAGKEIQRWKQGADHYANFIAAVRSRKPGDLNAEIEEGHLSSALCHTGNISYQLGKQLPPEAIRDYIKSEPEATESFGRLAEHLEKNGVDLAATPARLGAWLEMNPSKERFTNDKAANHLLAREYRKGFEVPSRV
jgi:predicted dehydrogenase